MNNKFNIEFALHRQIHYNLLIIILLVAIFKLL